MWVSLDAISCVSFVKSILYYQKFCLTWITLCSNQITTKTIDKQWAWGQIESQHTSSVWFPEFEAKYNKAAMLGLLCVSSNWWEPAGIRVTYTILRELEKLGGQRGSVTHFPPICPGCQGSSMWVWTLEPLKKLDWHFGRACHFCLFWLRLVLFLAAVGCWLNYFPLAWKFSNMQFFFLPWPIWLSSELCKNILYGLKLSFMDCLVKGNAK